MAVQDKTEPATPRRREEARQEGRVARSTDINSAMVLLAVLLMLKVAGPYMFDGLAALVRDTLANLHEADVSSGGLRAIALRYGLRVALISLPVVAAAGAVGLVSNVMQFGFRATSKPLTPDLSRMDPIKGMARLVSWRGLIELLKSLAKVVVVGWVVYAFLRGAYPQLAVLSGLSLAPACGKVAGLSWSLLARACVALLIIAILDYMYQRISFENSLKMTKQEVKEEFKRSEGDPHTKARIRQRMKELARRRMMQEVPKADVVVTNPTHLAVALRYDPITMSAPMVVAKGQRLVAEKIKAIAEANGVPLVENVQVARLLYKAVEIGQQVPEELYQAVAEILAYVYRISDKAGRYRRAA